MRLLWQLAIIQRHKCEGAFFQRNLKTRHNISENTSTPVCHMITTAKPAISDQTPTCVTVVSTSVAVTSFFKVCVLANCHNKITGNGTGLATSKNSPDKKE